jgi:hypothetical protein
MSKPGMETKVVVIVHPDELRALMRVGMMLSNGFGFSKTKLCRMAILEFIQKHDEPIKYRERGNNVET